ncbi:anthocyanin 3'-O-beta-glucosyltransferase-like [Asparagus officinalis]|nr:anthocyanin 3'-O-beta-glucosyltransferase-like [Asparagus officinalis]
MASSAPKLKVFFIPFYATGHMLPFLDLAFLFSTRPDIETTLLITAANASLLQPTIDSYGQRIKLLLFPFPSAESGLLPGQENVSSIPYADIYKMCTAADFSRDPIETLLRLHSPDAVVSDISFSWMSSLASELGIPNVIFHVIGVFPQRVMDALHRARLYDTEDTSDEAITIPNLPGEKQITMPRSELPWFVRKPTQLTHHWARMKAANAESFGVVVNTFCEMEPEFCEEYRRTVCRKAWFVGPVALAAARAGGKKAAVAGRKTRRLRRVCLFRELVQLYQATTGGNCLGTGEVREGVFMGGKGIEGRYGYRGGVDPERL